MPDINPDIVIWNVLFINYLVSMKPFLRALGNHNSKIIYSSHRVRLPMIQWAVFSLGYTVLEILTIADIVRTRIINEQYVYSAVIHVKDKQQ